MKKLNLHTLCAALALTGCLISCGGGGGGANSGLPIDPLLPTAQVPADPASFDFSGAGGGGDGGAGGAAGDGAPLRKAVIVITDATGQTASGLTDDKGNYFVPFTGFKAPLVAKVVDAGGNVLASATDEQPTKGNAVRIMINPLTDKIVSDSVVNLTAANAVPGTDKNFTGAQIDLAKFAQAKKDLRTSIDAALAKAGITSTAFDPIKSKYAYDGTGVDAVIESVSHTRDPNTGVTQLRTKSVSVDQPAVLITAAVPLATANVVLTTGNELTYTRLQNWINKMNACFATPNSATVTACDQSLNGTAAGANVISSVYKNNSKDFLEDFRTIFSGSNAVSGVSTYIPNTTFRNPVVLFTGKYPGSTASYDDLTVVEMTVRQPTVGPNGPNGASGAVSSPVEYLAYVVFKRDDSFPGASAGNWFAHGNQGDYDISVSPRYERRFQVNTAKAANTSGNSPSHLFSALRLNINTIKYNIATKTYGPSDIRAVRVTGPGLPAAGLVMSPSSTVGTSSLSVHNQTGTIQTSSMPTANTANAYRFNALTLGGSALHSLFWPTSAGTPGVSNNQTYSITPVTDFSILPEFSRYQFEIFLNSNTSGTPDAIEFRRTLAAVASPSVALAMPYNDIGPSHASITPNQPSAATATINWTVNLNAAPVNAACFYHQEGPPKPLVYVQTKYSFCAGVPSVVSPSSPPTSVVINSGAATLPTHTTSTGDYREMQVQSWQGRATYQNYAIWNN